MSQPESDPECDDPSGNPSDTPLSLDDETGFTGADIEEAYLKALQALEGVEWHAGAVAEPSGEYEDDPPEIDSAVAAAAATCTTPDAAAPPEPRPIAADARTLVPAASGQTIHGRRILEAALFVGGPPLSTKRLAALVGSHTDTTTVEELIDGLNVEYAGQGRPYEIRLGEGGYRLLLRSEFESVRNKVYGVGPREVRLSQDALEILALVAYRQPISQAGIEAAGKKNAGSLLRQLLRRELVGISRTGPARGAVEYHTTPRFLMLFGLANIDELPQAEELSLR